MISFDELMIWTGIRPFELLLHVVAIFVSSVLCVRLRLNVS